MVGLKVDYGYYLKHLIAVPHQTQTDKKRMHTVTLAIHKSYQVMGAIFLFNGK
jgi:hypothetical protein